jgi:hypothetical protein
VMLELISTTAGIEKLTLYRTRRIRFSRFDGVHFGSNVGNKHGVKYHGNVWYSKCQVAQSASPYVREENGE